MDNTSFLTAVSPQHPARIHTHRSFQSPGQDRSWWAQSGVMQPMWGPGYEKDTSAHPVLYLYLGAENKGKATCFSGTQRLSASQPNCGQTFLLFPSAVHTTMPLTKQPQVSHNRGYTVMVVGKCKQRLGIPPDLTGEAGGQSSFSTVLLPQAHRVPVMCGRIAKTKRYPTKKRTL